MVCSLVLCGDCFRVALFPKFVFSFVCVVNSYLRASATLLPATPRSFVSCSVVSSFFFFTCHFEDRVCLSLFPVYRPPVLFYQRFDNGK